MKKYLELFRYELKTLLRDPLNLFMLIYPAFMLGIVGWLVPTILLRTGLDVDTPEYAISMILLFLTILAIGGFISVPMAAISFTLQYAMGATATYSTTTVLGAMVGTHILIGIGEGLITGLTVSAVIASRSDLVYGWKNNNQKLEIRHA